MVRGLRPNSRAYKIAQAKEIRKVSNNLRYLVGQGIITKQDRKDSLKVIGQRIKWESVLANVTGRYK